MNVTEATPKTIEEIRAIIQSNNAANLATYAGLTSDEIARNSRLMMFGENDAAFPSPEEWARIVD